MHTGSQDEIHFYCCSQNVLGKNVLGHLLLKSRNCAFFIFSRPNYLAQCLTHILISNVKNRFLYFPFPHFMYQQILLALL